jgi:signal transduction histidine kinase
MAVVKKRSRERSKRDSRRRATNEALSRERRSREPASEAGATLRKTSHRALKRERKGGNQSLREQRGLASERAQLLGLAETAARHRDEVLSVVAHDLRNPVAAILMNVARLLARSRIEDPDARNAHGLEAIQRAAMRALRLIEDLVDAGALDAGQLATVAVPEAVVPLVTEAVDALRPAAAERSQELSLEVSVAANARVRCDPGRLHQVLSNLIGNAIKFTPVGGSITVTVERDGPDVRFSVADTGPGIPPHSLSRVFDRFWQGVPGGHGSRGLGLYIARGIVEAHGGKIAARSTVGRGSTFTFTIPTSAPAARTGSDAA